jgi:anaerobic ribonucleoside-triphosphate reductase activating protein
VLVARVLYPVEVLGYGKRVGIWLCGCNHNCKGCSNPELWGFDDKCKISVASLCTILEGLSSKHKVDGFTITGGEPFEQSEELAQLVESLKSISSDILVYTGYTLQELQLMKKASVEYVLQNISVLIDGKYIEEQNTNVVLRGSYNQKIHILNSIYTDRYNSYINTSINKIQNFRTVDGIVSVGIHKPDFINELENDIKKFGLTKE